MSMKIPKMEAVKFVIKSVLHKRVAKSQQELMTLVNQELRKVDPEYAITGPRLREIFVTMPEVKISVQTKKGEMPDKCPSCGSALRKAYARNLKGRKILGNLHCPKCGYKGHDGKWEPRRYRFWAAKSE